MDKEIILQVNDLVMDFEDMRAVDHVSLSLAAGDSVGLVGESGCGKSTMARLVTGLIRPSSGQILFHDKPYRLKSGRGQKIGINMVFQDPVASFDPHMTVEQSLYEALSHRVRINRKKAYPVIADAVKTVELSEGYVKRRISELSGGECQRIAIARALLTEPELLICDEATSALDVSVQAQIIHLLEKLKKEKDFTYLFIAHDLALVACMCNKVYVMYRGRIVEQGDTRDIMENPLHPYTRLLVSCAFAFAADEKGRVSSMPEVPENTGKIPQGCVYSELCPKASRRCMEEAPKLKSVEKSHMAACHDFKTNL